MFRWLIDLLELQRQTLKRIERTTRHLDALGFREGVDYSGIFAAIGITGAVGIELRGVHTERAANLVQALIRPDADARLVYVQQQVLFCGANYKSDQALERRGRHLRQELRHEMREEETDRESELQFELRVRQALAALTLDPHVDVQVPPDGASINIQRIPNEELACEYQRLLAVAMDEFALSVRFRYENDWQVQLEESIGKAA